MENPIEKKLIVLGGHGTQVIFQEIENSMETNVIQSNQPTNNLSSSLLVGIKRRIEEVYSCIRTEFESHKQHIESKLNRINCNIGRIVSRPSITSNPINNNYISQHKSYSLIKSPKDLYELWREYEFGLNGNKAAKEFTTHEKGTCRHTYSLRKGYWDIISKMVRSGHISDTAIDKVYATYGRNQSTTSILRSIRKDKSRGGHPNLI